MGENKLFEEVMQSPIQSPDNHKDSRQSARVKKKSQKARSKRAARIAEVTVRYIRTELKPPPLFSRNASDISLDYSRSRRESPCGAQAVEWFLLTTIDIQSRDDALDCITWYCLRWRIEDWHRVLNRM